LLFAKQPCRGESALRRMLAAKPLLVLAALVVAVSARNLRQNASLLTAVTAIPRKVSAAEVKKDSARKALANVTGEARDTQKLVNNLTNTVIKEKVELLREKQKLADLQVKENKSTAAFHTGHLKLHKKMEPKLSHANKTVSRESERAKESKSKLALAEKELTTDQEEATVASTELNASKIALKRAKTELQQVRANLSEATSRLKAVKAAEAKEEDDLLKAEDSFEAAKKDLTLARKRESVEEKSLNQTLATAKSEEEKGKADFTSRKAKLDTRLKRAVGKEEKAEKKLKYQQEAFVAWEEKRLRLQHEDLQSHDQYTKEDQQFNEKRSDLLKTAGASVAAETADRIGFDSSSDWAW